jgi:hypothetical protein
VTASRRQRELFIPYHQIHSRSKPAIAQTVNRISKQPAAKSSTGVLSPRFDERENSARGGSGDIFNFIFSLLAIGQFDELPKFDRKIRIYEMRAAGFKLFPYDHPEARASRHPVH